MTKSPKLLRVMCLLTAQVAMASAPPHIFFSDLESGPNTGGRSNGGLFVTIYGKRFGNVQGTSSVTVGGGAVAAYLIWNDSKIAFQLGAAAKSGMIVVHAPAGTSNGVAFRVRSGNIYAVSATGSDGAAGNFMAPWKTLVKARDAMRPGDTVYAMDGVSQATDDGYGWDAALTIHAEAGGAPNAPRAIVAYPGATSTIGSLTGPRFGIRTTGPPSHWVIAGMRVRGAVAAVHTDGPSTNWRFVANDMSCPNTITGSCFSTSKSSYVQFLGNNVHDVGTVQSSALNHGVYFSTDSNHLDVGWNTIANVKGCRGLQVHSTVIETGTGHNQYDIRIHDNLIHDTQCDGIVLATVDPSRGEVLVWNNVVYNAGKGPNNPERTGHWSCILVSGYTNAGPAGGGVVDVFHNTVYNCGSFAQAPYENARSGIANAGRNQNLGIRLRNNIVVPSPGTPYLTMWGPSSLCVQANCAGIQGTQNVFFGSGRAPEFTGLTASRNVDPLFRDAGQGDFHLKPQSPACAGGVETGHVFDPEGIRREDQARTLGAFTCQP